MSDLAYLATQNCTILVTPLILRGLPVDVDEDELMALRSVTKVLGAVVVADNPYLVTLDFLDGLQTAASISIHDNYNLVRAAFPNLDSASIRTSEVYNNFQLCPSQLLISNSNSNSNSSAVCSGLELRIFVNSNRFDRTGAIASTVA